MFIIFGFCSFEFLSFNGYNVQNFAILAEKIFGFLMHCNCNFAKTQKF